MKKSLLILTIVLNAVLCAFASDYPKVILPGDYPDPTILRDGTDYYMTHSPFSYKPGFLIWHSTDLINWEPICRVKGFGMAPDLVKHEGRYYIYFPWGSTNYVVWADDIRGPWSEPIDLKVKGIDPGHVVGPDGSRYLFLSEGTVARLDDSGLRVIDSPVVSYEGWQYPTEWVTECFCLESPKVFFKDGYYYLLSAQGGTAGPATSHMVVAARSKSVYGPWENSPYNPIVHTSDAEDEWWSKGHGSMVQDADRGWWIVYHAYMNDCHTLGRSTLIEPVEWTEDGWFHTSEHGNPKIDCLSPKRSIDISDDFSGKELGLLWSFWDDYSPKDASIRNGSLLLKGKGASPADGRLVLSSPSDRFYETQVEVGVGRRNKAGLVLYYRNTAFAGILSDGKTFEIYTNATDSYIMKNEFGKRFHLKIINENNICSFYASADGRMWKCLDAGIEVGSMNHNRYNGFKSLRIGLCSAGRGAASFKDFRYSSAPEEWGQIWIDPERTETKVSETLYGVFLEEINHSGDGGLYAELIRNRSFEDLTIPDGFHVADGKLYSKEVVNHVTGAIDRRAFKWPDSPVPGWHFSEGLKVSVIDSLPRGTRAPHYLRLIKTDDTSSAMMSNEGFWGINTVAGENYQLRMIFRADFHATLRMRAKLVGPDGAVLAHAGEVSVTPDDKWHDVNIKIPSEKSCGNACFTLEVEGKGRVDFDYVSLFPEKTYKGRNNGLRKDLAETIEALQPKFVRWPGGSIVGGITLSNRFDWKETLGDPADRPGQYITWGYRMSYGLGYHEYLEFCEDLGADAMFVCNAGMADLYRTGELCPDEELGHYVQDCLDAIEYAIGSTNTKWGAIRAENGHPDPFPLKYVQVGNEHWGEVYERRFDVFYDAIKAVYPDMIVLSDHPFTGIGESRKTDYADEHHYSSPEFFFAGTNVFDDCTADDFNGFIGEYACNKGVGGGNMLGALSEAVFINTAEKHSNFIKMMSYAPLLQHKMDRTWSVNLILHSADRVVGRSSYYVQRMNAENKPSYTVKTVYEDSPKDDYIGGGRIGFNLGDVDAEVTDIRITENGSTSSYTINECTREAGDFFYLPGTHDNRCVLEFKTTKKMIKGGIAVRFAVSDDLETGYSMEFGGWDGRRVTFQRIVDSIEVGSEKDSEAFIVKAGQTYRVRLEINVKYAVLYVDDVKVLEYRPKSVPRHFVFAGLDTDTREVILKMINVSEDPYMANIHIQGPNQCAASGTAIILHSDSPEDENSFDNPDLINPYVSSFEMESNDFKYIFEPFSYTVLRIPLMP